jgi:hypothetical protein
LFPFSSDNETSNPVYLSPFQVTYGGKVYNRHARIG